MKTIITKDTILKPYQDDEKNLRRFQIIGIVISILLIGLFVIGFDGDREARWEYLGVALFAFILLTIIPIKASQNSSKKIREINEGHFTIIKDVIANKDGDAKKDKGTGDYKWEYTIKGEKLGELPRLNKSDWEASEIGGEIYVVKDADDKLLISFPLTVYSLSDSLLEYVVPD